MDAGEDVFRKLEEHVSRLHFLVSEVHESLGLDPPTVVLRPSGAVIDVLRQHQQQQDRTISVKRQRHNDNTVTKKAPDGTAQILAASALCQLAGPEGEGSSSNSSISGGGGGATEECSSKEDSTSAASAKLDDMIVVAMANSVNNPILDDNEEATKTQIDEDIVVDVTLI